MFESKNKYFGRKKGKSFLRLEQYTKYLVEPKKTLFSKIKTPRIDIIQYIIGDFINILTTEAIIIPINPIIKNDPNLVRSLFVV